MDKVTKISKQKMGVGGGHWDLMSTYFSPWDKKELSQKEDINSSPYKLAKNL